jgi:cell wall-associated NlpC family hydrolase
MLDTIPIWVQSYVGLPYLCGGRTKENGLDCYGLVRLVLSERAKLTITNYSSDDVNTHQETAEHIRTGEKDWAPVEPPYRCFDVALMKTIVRHNDQVKNLPVHIGIFVSSSQVLHS